MREGKMRQVDRLIVNILSNQGRLVIELVAGLVTIPIVVSYLGRSSWGLISLILTIVLIFRRLADSIGRALQRFIPQDLAREDPIQLRRTFCTCTAGFLLMGLLGALVVWLLQGRLYNVADLEEVHRADGRLAYGTLVLWLAVGFPGFVYRRGLQAIQRYDIDGIITGAVTLIRTIAVIVLFWMGWGSITLFVATQLAAWILAALLSRTYMLRLTPGLAESPRYLHGPTAKALGAFTLMAVLMMAGGIIGNHGFRLFVGKKLGLHELAGLAAVLYITNLQGRLLSSVTSVLAPTISAQDARGAKANIAKLLGTGTKFAVVVSTAMCLVPIPLADPFLRAWLGKEFSGLGALMFILCVVQVPIAMGMTSQAVLMGLGKLRFVTPIESSQGIVGLLLGAAYVQFVGPNLTHAAALCYATHAVSRLAIFLYTCRVTGTTTRQVALDIVGRPLAFALASAALTWAIARALGSDAWWKLAAAAGAGEIVFLALVLTAALSEEERSRMLSFLSRALSWGRGGRGRVRPQPNPEQVGP